ncbi:hypothetical protein ACTPOK_00900 [Streptomyces inhibens]|uniref:hypothetical protein n=1 Tax=Streptomyces inhibens TaxID=2293571 RepID=UPI00402AB97D
MQDFDVVAAFEDIGGYGGAFSIVLHADQAYAVTRTGRESGESDAASGPGFADAVLGAGGQHLEQTPLLRPA